MIRAATHYTYALGSPVMFTDPTGNVTWGNVNLAPITPKDLLFVEAVVEDRISKLKGNTLTPLGPTKQNCQWAEAIRSKTYQRKFDALQLIFNPKVGAVAHALGGDYRVNQVHISSQ
jgi:hypothetical protein